jgi:hypothetical protein
MIFSAAIAPVKTPSEIKRTVVSMETPLSEAKPIWIMQYLYSDNPDVILTWGDYFSSPDEGEKFVRQMNAHKLSDGKDTIQVAWYKQVKKYEKVTRPA